jgi:hypothetical protein
MAATTVFYWIAKGNTKVIIEAGKKAAAALRKGGAKKATKEEVANMPARRRRVTESEAKRLFPPKPRKSPTSGRQPRKKLTPEAQAQADRLRDLSQQSGVPITSEAQAKAFEAFAKGGTRKWWNSVSPKKKATMAAAAGFATVGGFYAWLSTGKGKPDFAAVRRAEARAKRQALPGLSLTREQALLRDKQPVKTNGSSTTASDKKLKAARVLPRGPVSNGITRYNSGSFNAAYAKERAKAMKAGEPDTGEFYWKGDKYTTRIKSQKPPEVDKKRQELKDSRPRTSDISGPGSWPKTEKAEEPGWMPWNWQRIKGDPHTAGPGVRVYKTPLGEIEVDSRSSDDEFVGMNKKGGQVKKSLKKAKARKRAALRGHRAELRGG